ncbi:phosphatidate cytidylyltransferase [Micromonospora sp. NBC_01796]|uniref:phosphatidate cytidylyltransferase n=1 Tax=Micromonospora sp. NBC_01796 TaxID=2975987 RepID=UPI002DD9E875|nr:phosphatidate cytidylyltransferase [Micromonospora sp. NBC_01796]WSA87047.1 phosphatidate cytidylyltransferase [Micromonospora sp. NBC_01796]
MSYLDPNGSAESQGRQRQDGPAGPYWPDAPEEPRLRARHTGAAPEAVADPPGYAPVSGYRHGDAPARRDGYTGPPGPYGGPPGPYAGTDRPDGPAYGPGDSGAGYPGGGYPGGDDLADAGADGLTDPVGWAPIRGFDQQNQQNLVAPPGYPNQPRADYGDPRQGRPEQVDPGRLHPEYVEHGPGGMPDGAPALDPEEAEPTGARPRTGRRRAGRGRPATLPANSRAGRNLPAAIGVGLGLGAAVVLPLVLLPVAFFPVIAAAVAIGIWEMTQAVRRGGAEAPLVPLVVGGVLMVGLAWWAGPDALSLGLLVTVLATMVWRLGDGPAGFQRDITAATLIAVYVPFLGGFAALLAAEPTNGPLRVVVTIAAVVLSDTGGYAAGVMFGKHPMAPSVSPKKSWEGFAGSVLAAAGGSALLLFLLFDVNPLWGALFGVAVSGAAVLGDLGESMIKRDLGVKDMSNLLPGHGGLMDRLDSVLFAVPVAYLLLALLVPVG